MTTGSGQRWMLKFYVGFFGGSDPNEMIPEAVLKTYIYKEQGSPVFAVDSLKRTRRGLVRRDMARDLPTVSNRMQSPDAEAAWLQNVNRAGIGTTGSSETGTRERDYVVRFTGNGFTADVDLSTEEAGDQAQKDLRFKAVLQSAAAEAGGATGMPELQQWMGEGQAGETTLVAAEGRDGSPNKFDLAAIFSGYNVQAIFYIEQLEGFFGVAELINKGKPTIRRLLISLHIQGTDGRKQRYIVTPPYDVTILGELYTVGFHQETHGDQSWLEFIIGRDDNYAPFATYNLAREDEFFFKRSADSGKTEVGIGCWPELSDEKPALHFTGYIKEIICDPWGECTRC